MTENFLPVEVEGCLDANRLVRVCAMELNAEMVVEAVEAGTSGLKARTLQLS
jgi:hypothetical protein